uniref:Centrosomal protein of 162 kDa n=1 Tax=Steinernema glaseri TaxID=37863 RepID=A0A1I8A1K6_9BILA
MATRHYNPSIRTSYRPQYQPVIKTKEYASGFKAKLQQHLRDQRLLAYDVKVKNLEKQHEVDQKTIAEQKQEINRFSQYMGDLQDLVKFCYFSRPAGSA